MDPTLCEEIRSHLDDEAPNVGTLNIGFGKATRSWGRITSNEFAKYAPIFWKRY